MAAKEDSMSVCHLRPPEDKLPSRAVFGKLQVELRGLGVYDPTSSEIRSSSTGDIACWSIDSDYNEESFFVRQLQRRRRAAQEAPARPQGRDWRGRLVNPLQHREPPVRDAVDRQDRS